SKTRQRWFGLTFDLKKGWKIFWRSPGAPGLPPTIDWSGSVNLRAGDIIWPAPVVFDSFGYRARGYGGRVTLPIRVTPIDPADPVMARLRVRYQVCKDICIPGEVQLALTGVGSAPMHPAITRALKQTPKLAGSDFMTWQAVVAGRRLIVRIRHRSQPLVQPTILVEAPEAIRLGRAGLPWFAPDGTVSVSVPVLGTKPIPVEFRVRITAISNTGVWERAVTVSGRGD
ncbi:MAG: protein-disulfide reductase DsbD family protein, partial [Rhodospirillaceae bacterium]|nr:protein-disulfide reductase DsbD family protein [Rhodospirillaceae bacterium]